GGFAVESGLVTRRGDLKFKRRKICITPRRDQNFFRADRVALCDQSLAERDVRPDKTRFDGDGLFSKFPRPCAFAVRRIPVSRVRQQREIFVVRGRHLCQKRLGFVTLSFIEQRKNQTGGGRGIVRRFGQNGSIDL